MLEDLFRIPYYKAIITRDGVAYASTKVKMASGKAQFFRVKKLRKAFILPDISDIPPIRVKSGVVLVYDDRNAFPLDLLPSDVVTNIKSDESTMLSKLIGVKNAEQAVKPNYWVRSAIDPDKLHEWFEARIVEDILSPPPNTDFPMWAVYLIAVVAVVAIVAGTLYLLSGRLMPDAVTPAVNAIPTLPGGYIVVP